MSHSSYLLFLLTTSVTTQYASTSSLSTHGAVFPNGLTFFNADNINTLPSPSNTVTQWPWGIIPEACHSIASNSDVTDCHPYDVEVFSVRYSDCAAPWTVCRCTNAEATLETVIDRLGRIPVLARETIRYVHVHKQISGTAGLSFFWDGDVVFFGEATGMGLYLHEVAHNMDFWIAGAGRSMYSQQEAWKKAVLGEACVADDYAKTSLTEAFAQVAVSVAYDVNVASIHSVGDINCMAETFENVRSQLGWALHYTEGQRCESRIAEDDVPIICLNSEAPCPASLLEVTTMQGRGGEGIRPMARGLGAGERKRLADAVREEIKEHKHRPISDHNHVPVA